MKRFMRIQNVLCFWSQGSWALILWGMRFHSARLHVASICYNQLLCKELSFEKEGNSALDVAAADWEPNFGCGLGNHHLSLALRCLMNSDGWKLQFAENYGSWLLLSSDESFWVWSSGCPFLLLSPIEYSVEGRTCVFCWIQQYPMVKAILIQLAVRRSVDDPWIKLKTSELEIKIDNFVINKAFYILPLPQYDVILGAPFVYINDVTFPKDGLIVRIRDHVIPIVNEK